MTDTTSTLTAASRFMITRYRDPWIHTVATNRNGRASRPVQATELAAPGTLGRLGPWTRCPDADHCWLRTVEGGDASLLTDRRVFIEKTPRVFDPSFGLPIDDCYSWIQGDKGEADNGEGPDEESMDWADALATAIGYVVPDRLDAPQAA